VWVNSKALQTSDGLVFFLFARPGKRVSQTENVSCRSAAPRLSLNAFWDYL
jgi:hypothetical protein